MRGEYNQAKAAELLKLELPPRARRIRAIMRLGVLGGGTTSACAENTGGLSIIESDRWNYLRVRGEYEAKSDISGVWGELPPRARRIRDFLTRVRVMGGTTSACAENTLIDTSRSNAQRNYLRVRGEYH